MPKLEGHHPFCRSCGEENATPRYKWCFACRMEERRKKRRQRNSNGIQKQNVNACGLPFVDMVNAAGPTDALVDGLQCRPGRSGLGWWEVV